MPWWRLAASGTCLGWAFNGADHGVPIWVAQVKFNVSTELFVELQHRIIIPMDD